MVEYGYALVAAASTFPLSFVCQFLLVSRFNILKFMVADYALRNTFHISVHSLPYALQLAFYSTMYSLYLVQRILVR